ncbi:MAG: TPM domain-containing protein [Ideonella sp.]
MALLVGSARAEFVVPPLQQRITDLTGTLTPAQVQALDGKLAAFEAEAGPQIVVLMIPSTAPEDIAALAFRVADSWKVGRREVGDGLLILVAKDDRRMRIEVAKALEGAVPDLAARQIIDRQMKPAFRTGDYAGGLNLAIDQLMLRLKGEALPAPAARSPGGQAASGLGGIEQLALFFFLGVPVVGSVLSAVLGRKAGSGLTALGAGSLAGWWASSVLLGGVAGLVALVLVGVMGSGRRSSGGHGGMGLPPFIGGGWGGGGGGGGGFSSGGGGDFGGGGASGDW